MQEIGDSSGFHKKLEPYIILRKFFISEHIFICTPTYHKIEKIHEINFLDA